MKPLSQCVFRGGLIAAIAAVMLAPAEIANARNESPFDILLGTWAGSGEIALQGGKAETIKCNAYYTGGGSDLGLAIRCQSVNYKIEIRSKLSQSAGRISGTWEERTFNAVGTASGKATGDKISLQISGGVTGTMLVSYSGSRQSVAISTQGIALQSVTIALTRS